MHNCFQLGEATRKELRGSVLWVGIAILAFNAAYHRADTGVLALFYLFALVQIAQAERWRFAFYPGLIVGLLISVVHLAFFYNIFFLGAAALWIVFSIWIGLFAALARLCLRRFGGLWGWIAVPFIWVGLEYFRSELYYLRFSWLSPGYAFAGMPWQAPFGYLGVYGMGFLLMSIACLAAWVWPRARVRGGLVLVSGAGLVLAVGYGFGLKEKLAAGSGVQMAGVQMEFPTEKEVLTRLDELLKHSPGAQLIVLSEYTFDEPVPPRIREWCRKHRRYLIAGGKEAADAGKFYNTAFVVDPEGEIVFRQVKRVPIQFFKDGLPAPEQRLWESPWGKLGICICYDLSYTRVTDRLVRMGAEALIVPTMDVADWGKRQHVLHGRIAPIRAAEYGIPVFRVASSGISQCVDARGAVLDQAPCPGEGATIAGRVELGRTGGIPFDRWLAPFAVGVTVVSSIFMLPGISYRVRKSSGKTVEAQAT